MKPEEMIPPEWSMRPEFVCRPPLGLGSPDFEPVLDMHPNEGPADCVLLTVRYTSTKGRINGRIGVVIGEESGK